MHRYDENTDVAIIKWKLGDIIGKMQELGIEPNDNNIAFFLQNTTFDGLESHSVEVGWVILHDMITDLDFPEDAYENTETEENGENVEDTEEDV